MITYREKNWTTFGSLFENIGKQNGDEYEPNTLTSILRSFDRFLRDKEKYFSILTDIQFAEVKEALFFKAETAQPYRQMPKAKLSPRVKLSSAQGGETT